MYVYSFRIKFKNPFGTDSYFQGACATTEKVRMHDMIMVSDRNGNMSGTPAEVYQISRAGRPATEYSHIFVGVLPNG